MASGLFVVVITYVRVRFVVAETNFHRIMCGIFTNNIWARCRRALDGIFKAFIDACFRRIAAGTLERHTWARLRRIIFGAIDFPTDRRVSRLVDRIHNASSLIVMHQEYS